MSIIQDTGKMARVKYSHALILLSWLASMHVDAFPLSGQEGNTRSIIINTNGQPLITNGQSPFLTNLQQYDPISSEQQMGSVNFLQPNVLTGQKIEIQSASTRPVFGVYSQQYQCTPITGLMQTQQLLQEQQQHQQHPPGYDQKYPGQDPGNTAQQIIGAIGPLQMFQAPNHVPLSLQMTSQIGQPIFVNNKPQQQQQSNAFLQGGFGSSSAGQEEGQLLNSGFFTDQARQPHINSNREPVHGLTNPHVIQPQYFNPSPSPRPTYASPVSRPLQTSERVSQLTRFKPINSGRRRVGEHAESRMVRQANFDPRKMKAEPFRPSSMNAASYDPDSANTVNSQNPAFHPVGKFDPSSLPADSFNPANGNPGNIDPSSSLSASSNQRSPSATSSVSASPSPIQSSLSTKTVSAVTTAETEQYLQTGLFGKKSQEVQNLNGQNGPPRQPNSPVAQSQGQSSSQGFKPISLAASSYDPSQSGLFDPSIWSAFLGRRK